MTTKKILFLCTGNSCRSQMAEAYAKKYWKNIDVYSAGLEKHGLNPYMLKVMSEDGFTMKEHYSKTLDDVNGINFDVVLTLCGHANESCPTYLKKSRIIHVGFEDPALAKGNEEDILKCFRKIRDQIKYFIQNNFINIFDQGDINWEIHQ